MDAEPAPTCDEDNEIWLRPNKRHGLCRDDARNNKCEDEETEPFHLLIPMFT